MLSGDDSGKKVHSCLLLLNKVILLKNHKYSRHFDMISLFLLNMLLLAGLKYASTNAEHDSRRKRRYSVLPMSRKMCKAPPG